MRHLWAVMLALSLAPVGGCISTPNGPAANERGGTVLAPFRGPTGNDIVQMDIALIERPADDPFINEQVWTQVDEQGIRVDGAQNLEQKALLARNGFRVGQLFGAPPAELCRLVASERNCVNPHRLTMHANRPTNVMLGSAWSRCTFDLKQDKETVAVDLDRASCLIQVTPLLTEEGRTILRFTPAIKHGEALRTTRPAVDPSGTRFWEMKVEQPTETYSDLSWELAVGPNENVLIGTVAERGDTLGQRSFVFTEGMKPVQRLLVLRVGRSLPSAAETMPADADLARAPLVLQVTNTAYRAKAP